MRMIFPVWIATFCLALARTTSLAAGEAETPPAEQERPVLPEPEKNDARPFHRIPLMKASPTIDGVIGEDEWPTLRVAALVAQKGDPKHARLEPRPAAFWIGCDGKDLLIAMRSALHPDGAVANRKPKKSLRDVRSLELDDTLELWVNNTPLSDKGIMYQFKVNTLGARADVRRRLKFDSFEKYWRPKDWRVGQKTDDGIWVIELAIPLAELEIADPTLPLGVRVCRDFQKPTDQARWASGVTRFDDLGTMPLLAFDPAVALVQERSLTDEKGAAVELALSNITDAPVEATAVYTVQRIAKTEKKTKRGTSVTWVPQGKPAEETKTLSLAAGKDGAFAFQTPVAENEVAEVRLVVRDGQKRLLYHRFFRAAPAGKPGWE